MAPAKTDRSAFAYQDPRPPEDEFAQCSTCRYFGNPGCSYLGRKDVDGGMSCDFYCHGKPGSIMLPSPAATPEEAGLVDRPVRCENCRHFKRPGTCGLFERLNREAPDAFKIDTHVHAKGCCDAQTEKAKNRARGGALALAEGGDAEAQNPFDQFDAGHEAVNPFSRFDVEPPTPPREKPTAPGESFLGRVGSDVASGIHAARNWAVGQHEAVGKAVAEPIEQAWNAPEPANTPENRGAAPPWLYDVLNKADRVVQTGMATLPAAIGAASAALGLDPHAVNQAINDYLPGMIGVEGMHGAAEARPAEDAGTATLRNIAEGRPPEAPRAPAAEPGAPAAQEPPPTRAPAATATPPGGTTVARGDEDTQRWAERLAQQQRPSPSSPEPKSDIDAQLRALTDPGHPKDSVFVARGNASALPPEAPPGVHMVRTPDGTLLTTDPEKATAFARGPRDDRLMARILGYPQPKDEVLRDIAVGRPSSVIQARDADGNVISEAVASDRGREATRQALAQHGQLVEMQTPEAIARRRRLLAQEQAAPPLGNEVEGAPPWEPGPERPGMWNAPPAPEEAAEEREQAGRPVGEAQEPARAAAPAPAPAPKRPPNLIEFLASRGGLEADEGGDLEAMDAHKKFVPGYGKLVRKSGGMSLDEAREAAEEAGYLQPGSDINDFLGALDDNLRGRHVFSDRDLSEAEEWRQAQWAERQPGMAAETAPFAVHAESWRDRAPSDEGWRDGKAIPWGKSPGVAQDLTSSFDRWLQANAGRYAGLDPHLIANLAAMHWLHEMGRDNPIEHLVTIGGKDPRQSYAVTTGHFNQVQLPMLLRLALSREGNDLIVHHNHPTPWGLSASDLSIPLAKGARAIVAHDVNGDIHGATITDYGRRAAVGDPYQTPRQNWRAIMREAQIEIASRLHRLEKAGVLSGDQLNEIGHELQGHALAAADMIDYVSSKPRPDYFPENEWNAAIKAGADAAITKAYEIGAKTAEERALHERALAHALDYQPTVAGSADEGMARLLGEPPGRVPEAPGPEPAGGHQGRAGDDQVAGQGRGRQAPGAQGQLEGTQGRQLPPARREGPPGTQYRLLTKGRGRPPHREMTITLGRDVGYASAGETYQAVQDKPGGRWHLTNPRTGAGTDILPAEMQRGIKDGSIRDVTERTDQGEQRVIPGAEQRPEEAQRAKAQADKARAEQQMKGALRPKREQEDFGSTDLGGEKGEQGSLLTTSGFGRQGEMPVSTPQEARRNGIIARSFLGKIFSPSTVGPAAERTVGIAREEHGQANRLTQQVRATLQRYRNAAPSLGTPEGNDLMAYMEGRSGGAQLADPTMRPIADEIRRVNKDRERAVRQLPGQAQRAFIEDYFAHMWKDPRAALNAVQQRLSTTRGATWQGSGQNLKARTIPTYADGIAMGLEPLHPNIIDGEMAYVSNIDRFIGTNRILMRMKAEGLAREFFPGRAPDGWTEMKGALVDRARPLGENGAAPTHTYAPEDAARVYNNMISKGVWDTAAGPLYDKLLRFKNFQTMAELSFSAFHASTMATEAMFSQIGRAAGLLRYGKPLQAAKAFATFPIAPVRNYFAGRRMAAEYLDPGSQSGQIGQAMNLLSRANMTPIGRGEAQYFASGKRAFGQSVTTGGLKAKAAGMARDLKDAFGEMGKDIGNKDALGLGKHIGGNLARTMDTISAPLFDHAIPRLKAGAALDRMTDWLNTHPGATMEEQLKAARDISDSIDNRFGELNYDNVFWHNAMKQIAFLSLRAFGWDLGTHREIEGGIGDVMRGRWSPRVEYLVGLAVGSTLLNGAMSYLKTGHAPQNPMDLFAYDTGHKDSRGNEIRAMLPGYAREYVTLAMNAFAKGPGQALGGYGYNKLASTWETAWELFTNRDYRDDPIGPPGAGFDSAKARAQLPEFLRRYMVEALGRYVPINWRAQLGVEPQRGMSALSPAEQAVASRPAPFAVQNPTAARGFFEKLESHPRSPEERWRSKLRRERRSERP